jgi:hypothetical protein
MLDAAIDSQEQGVTCRIDNAWFLSLQGYLSEDPTLSALDPDMFSSAGQFDCEVLAQAPELQGVSEENYSPISYPYYP